MIVRKKQLTIQEKKEILDTLDIIDISLYDLLVKRRELQSELEQEKNSSAYDLLTNLSTSIQKITEQRKYNRDILSLTAGLLNASNFNTHNLEIGIQSPKAGDTNQRGVLSHIKNFFPFIDAIKYKTFSKQKDVLDALLTYTNMIGCIPATKTSPKDVWWISMLSPDRENIKIINKVPFSNTDENREYLISKTNSFYGFDRSVIVIATSETITNNWLKTALHKVNVPLYNIIDSTAIFNGTVLHLIEVSHKIESANDDIFKLNETLNGINIRMAGYLGGYFLPLVDKDKIVSFNPTFGEK